MIVEQIRRNRPNEIHREIIIYWKINVVALASICNIQALIFHLNSNDSGASRKSGQLSNFSTSDSTKIHPDVIWTDWREEPDEGTIFKGHLSIFFSRSLAFFVWEILRRIFFYFFFLLIHLDYIIIIIILYYYYTYIYVNTFRLYYNYNYIILLLYLYYIILY